MIGFEKWICKYQHPETHCGIDIAEDGWRAALEEVLDWLDYSTEHKEIADKIHEELEDEIVK